MKLSKRVKSFIALIASLYCVSLVQSTYAKYISGVDSDADLSIARWNIVLTGSDNGTNMVGDIKPKFEGTSYINQGVMAPTSEGYFDVAINGSTTDVAFRYTLNASIPEESLVSDLVITGYSIKNIDSGQGFGPITSFASTPYSVQGVVDIRSSIIVRFYVKWNDDEATQSMNNANDTDASIAANAKNSTEKAIIRVNANFVQESGR